MHLVRHAGTTCGRRKGEAVKTIITAIAVLAAAPAAAQQPSEPISTVTAPVQSGGPEAQRAKKTRYCVQTELTGSRLTRKVCQTREAWLAQDFDPLDKAK
jgi:hypothetical protein